ncbi:MAG: hypothetical protein NVS4B7_10110 [Ktedonobacteraceae bacterium]
MRVPKTPPSQSIITTAERVLSEAFGGTVHLGEGENLQGGLRSLVYRFNILEGPSHTPASVIVKQVKSTEDASYDPDSPTIPAWTLFNEWASLQFLEEIANEAAFGPRFYGGDRAAGLLVVEDLGHGIRLDQLLMGSDPLAAESALIEFAAVHGRLHAATIGRQDEFKCLRESSGPSVLEDGHYTYQWLAPTFYEMADLLEITLEPGVENELATLKAAMLQPGPFLTFIQGDSCPDNCLFIGSTLRLLDFEGGRLDHALKEGIYGRMRFPTCLCVYQLPEHIPLRMENAYRAEFVKGCPEAADDMLFYHAIAEACVYWLIEWYRMVPLPKILAKDRLIATATDRQRYLMRSDVVVKTTEELGHLKAIGAAIRAMAVKMRLLWPDVTETPYYPAFR